jgi:hypothetical protein
VNTNDIIYEVAARAKELADKPIMELRIAVATENFLTGILRETKGRSRGDLMEEILTDEFVEEFPRDVVGD